MSEHRKKYSHTSRTKHRHHSHTKFDDYSKRETALQRRNKNMVDRGHSIGENLQRRNTDKMKILNHSPHITKQQGAKPVGDIFHAIKTFTRYRG